MPRARHFANLFYFGLLVTLASCAGTGENRKLETGKVVMTLSGPLYEGSNTATVEWTPALKMMGVQGKNCTSARVESIVLRGNAEQADLFSDITFSLAAPGADMQRVGVLNPVQTGDTVWTLQVAGEQDQIEAFLQGKPITLVADLNLKRDREADMSLTAELVFEAEFK